MSRPVDIDKIRGQLAEQRRQVDADANAAKPVEVAPLSEWTRYSTTKLVMGAYLVVVGAVVILIMAEAWRGSDFDKLFGSAMELLKVAIIPVVTFVIGHYYGKK
ncbi:MAG: hypothetical protein LDL39_05400 [Magnetospirillum sp.]|nr:hypothetical protein [Magnetospirillum sp.]